MLTKQYTIKIELVPDEDNTFDYLGSYSTEPGPRAIDREKRGDARPNTMRYWNPWGDSSPTKGESERSRRAQEFRAYRFMESINDGSIRAVGVVVLVEADGVEVGRESLCGLTDDDEDYLKQVSKDLIAQAMEAL